MADHIREQIVVAVQAAITGLTTTTTHVFRDRDTDEKPLASSELPGLTIEDDGEPAEVISMGTGRLLDRTMGIRITAHVKASSGYSTQLNTILKEIEAAIGAAVNLGGAKWACISRVEGRETSAGGDKTVVRQGFIFDLYYVTAHNAPDVAL